MKPEGSINIEDYNYELPRRRIAEYPVEKRDRSKLLVMDKNQISSDHFYNIHDHLPDNGVMVFNNTRVIRARLVFRKATGARIEIFCLEAVEPSSEINIAFESGPPVIWKCLVGNAKKWRYGMLEMNLGDGNGSLFAERAGEEGGTFLIKFTWDKPTKNFADIIDEAGNVPLPPYIEREAEEEDKLRYQTIYARHDGSVAAPTAGLHFTEEVFQSLKKKGTSFENVTLHVGAGTFKPVSDPDLSRHEMHTEQIIITQEFINALMNNKGHLTAVGTTSMRTLESLYCYGVMLENDEEAAFSISQWYPYQANNPRLSKDQALGNVLKRMKRDKLKAIAGDTSLIIVPGYEFHIADILITNFHMPKSTLLLLVAAFAGDRWKEAYEKALSSDYRFLSYGDSCLFFRKDYNS